MDAYTDRIQKQYHYVSNTLVYPLLSLSYGPTPIIPSFEPTQDDLSDQGKMKLSRFPHSGNIKIPRQQFESTDQALKN
jgi:hypothetical protein